MIVSDDVMNAYRNSCVIVWVGESSSYNPSVPGVCLSLSLTHIQQTYSGKTCTGSLAKSIWQASCVDWINLDSLGFYEPVEKVLCIVQSAFTALLH